MMQVALTLSDEVADAVQQYKSSMEIVNKNLPDSAKYSDPITIQDAVYAILREGLNTVSARQTVQGGFIKA